MNQKFDEAWTSRQQLLETVLKFDAEKEEEIPQELFEQMEKLNSDKEALEQFIPGLKKMIKSDPEQQENLETIKSAVQADNKMAELIQDYMTQRDKDAFKYEIARVFTSHLNTNPEDLQEIINMKPEHLENVQEHPEMSYQEFMKAITKIIPSPSPGLKNGKHAKNKNIEVVKEDSFEYEVSDHDK